MREWMMVTRRLSSRMEKRALTRPLAPDVRSRVDDVSDIVSTAIDDGRKVVTVIGRLLFRVFSSVTGNLKVESFLLYIKIVPLLLEQIINERKMEFEKTHKGQPFCLFYYYSKIREMRKL